MKLVLASEALNDKIAHEIENLIGDKLAGKKVALIPNAAFDDGKQNYKKDLYDSIKNNFGNRQMLVDLVDLNHRTDEELRNSLAQADIICVEGGLASLILPQIYRTKFAEYLSAELDKGKLYLGFSVGSMILSKTLHTATWFIGESDPAAANLSGLGLIDFEIYPHYQDNLKQEIVALVPDGITVYGLRNDDAIVIDGDRKYYVSEQPIIISGSW